MAGPTEEDLDDEGIELLDNRYYKQCPDCGGLMEWCSCCETWNQSCCVEYGTCMCS